MRNKPEEGYKFYQNKSCEFFPCHSGANADTFNCLFCYCPLYALGEHCGGNCTYTAKGIKDCSACMIPHGAFSYEKITSNFNLLADKARKTSA